MVILFFHQECPIRCFHQLMDRDKMKTRYLSRQKREIVKFGYFYKWIDKKKSSESQGENG